MAFMRNTNTNHSEKFTRTDSEIVLAAVVRQRIDDYIDTSSIDKKLNLFIMTEIMKYKKNNDLTAVNLSVKLDFHSKEIAAIVAPQVPGLLAMNEPQHFPRAKR